MHKFKRKTDFKTDRPFHKKFDRFAPKNNSDRPERRFGGGGDKPFRGRTLEMTDAVCDKCGKECQVPFRPTRGKPIFCRDCFQKNDDRDSFEPRGDAPEHKSDELQQINRKLDKIMKALKIN